LNTALEYFLGDHAPSAADPLTRKGHPVRRSAGRRFTGATLNSSVADYDAEQFIADILVNRLRIRHLVIGDDFHFGKPDAAIFAHVTAKGLEYGFAVKTPPHLNWMV